MTLNLAITSTESLVFEPARRTLRLGPAIGGVQIELTLTVRRTAERKEAPPYQVSAAMLVAQNPSRDRRLLAPLAAGHLVNPVQVATEFRLTGFISVEQLRVVEELRSGADSIWVVLQVSVTCVDGEPTTLVGGNGEFSFALPAGEWLQELERVDAATYVEILVPLTSNTEHANAVRRLRNARTLIQDDRVEEALAEARKTLEFVRKAGGTAQIVQQAAAKKPRDRDLRERWAYLVEDIFSLLSGAAHDDQGTTEHFTWTRADAVALVASTAGLLGRLAEQANF
jgi:predicted pyridoxine 5'-phosphate oxidase superfamily flavin-nucleotide-binding protein